MWSISKQNHLDWGEAGVVLSNIPQNRIHHVHTARFSIANQYSMERLWACVYFNIELDFKLQELWINSQDLTAPQFNSSCLEINYFRAMTTGRVHLGQRFYRTRKQNFSKESSCVSSELESIVSLYKRFKCNSWMYRTLYIKNIYIYIQKWRSCKEPFSR